MAHTSPLLNTDMFTAALNGLVERFNLQGQRLGEVVAGAMYQAQP